MALTAVLTLANGPVALAASGTLNCASGGNPITAKIGSPSERVHEVQYIGIVISSDPSEIWTCITGSRLWWVTPGSGSGSCIL